MSRELVILAGGLGSRLGGIDKSSLLIEKETFLERQLREFSKRKIYISINSENKKIEKLTGINLVYDSERIGPLGGLYHSLEKIYSELMNENDYVDIISCDSPFVTEEFFEYLDEFKGYDAIIPLDRSGKSHPLIGRYSLRVLKVIKNQIDLGDYKLFNFLKEIKVKYVKIEYTKFSDKIFFNVNNKKDYRSLLKKELPYFAVSGIKNSGKTTIITKLIEKFVEKGFKVGTLKHDGHDYPFDTKGSDTDKHVKSGASMTMVFSKTKSMKLIKEPKREVEDYLNEFNSCDLVILEGFKGSSYPKIEVIRKENSTEINTNREGLLFYLTDVEEILEDKEKKSVHLKDIERAFEEILRYLEEEKCLTSKKEQKECQ